ncbi:hypothetical protein [Methylobacterium sp. CB376]
MALLRGLQALLHRAGLTIEGAKRVMNKHWAGEVRTVGNGSTT